VLAGFLAAAIFLAAGARAEEPLTLESVAQAYFASSSYCDAGKWGQRVGPAQGAVREETFQRCASRDGRFKRTDSMGPGGKEIRWSDGKLFYRYLPQYERYQALSLDDAVTYGLYRNRAEAYPAFMFEIFSAEPRDFTDPVRRAAYLKAFVPSPGASNAQYTVFEHPIPGTRWSERLWILNADRSIARWESFENDALMRYTEIASHQFNRALGEADVSYEAPALARYSLMNNPQVFVSALIAAPGILGLLVWPWLPRAAYDKRRFLWKLQFWIYGILGAVLLVLAALTWPGGGGHPPAIFFVLAMAAWVGIAFAMTALFVLASYPAEFIARRRWARA